MDNKANKFNSFLQDRKRILITGGGGFIGGALIRRLLLKSSCKIYNIDKVGYATDLTSINQVLNSKSIKDQGDYSFLKVDLADNSQTSRAIKQSDPDLVMHLAAESHVDKSINDASIFLNSNVIGTFNLIKAVTDHYESLSKDRKNNFRFHHISTDEVFGSLEKNGRFSEESSYDPRNPYSATKAASDHLVRAWHHTYKLPIIITNCSNNFGPWQFPEKLIPLAITNAISGNPIKLYGDGKHIRDWLYVEDHIDALLLAANKGLIGHTYCIGGQSEKTNHEVLISICHLLDHLLPRNYKYSDLIVRVEDRAGHDRRYAIDPTKVMSSLGWEPKHKFENALEKTVLWYIENIDWAKARNIS